MIKSSSNQIKRGRREAAQLGIGVAQRHVLMCVDRKTAKCASRKQLEQSWKHLKKRLKDFKVGGKPGVLRTKSYCLGICKAGPILVVQPDGSWYGNCTPEVIDQIIEQHLIQGRVVDEYLLAQAPPCMSASENR